jgi:hypothetical protein
MISQDLVENVCKWSKEMSCILPLFTYLNAYQT